MDNRTRALVQGLRRASDVRVYINRVEDLSYHLLEFPETSGVAVKVRNLNRLAFFFSFFPECWHDEALSGKCMTLLSMSKASTFKFGTSSWRQDRQCLQQHVFMQT